MSDRDTLRISWSQLRAWDECHQKVHLKRSGKRNPAQDIRGFFHGTVADRVMRTWLETEELRSGHMAEMVDEIAEREERVAAETGDGVVRWKNAGDKVEMLAWVRTLVDRLEPILRTHVLPYDYEPAKRFKTPVEIPGLNGEPRVIYLTGEVDILCRDPQRDQWAVWDLKATADNQYWRKTINQMVFYDLYVLVAMGKTTTVTGLIQPMCDQPVVPMRVVDDQRRDDGRIVAMAHGIWRNEFEVAATNGPCYWCEVKHACPKWDPKSAQRATLTGGAPSFAELAGLSVG